MPVPTQTTVIRDNDQTRIGIGGALLQGLANPFLGAIGQAAGRWLGDMVSPDPNKEFLATQAKVMQQGYDDKAYADLAEKHYQEIHGFIKPGSTAAYAKARGYNYDPAALESDFRTDYAWGNVIKGAASTGQAVEQGRMGAPPLNPFNPAGPPPTATPGPPNQAGDIQAQLAPVDPREVPPSPTGRSPFVGPLQLGVDVNEQGLPIPTSVKLPLGTGPDPEVPAQPRPIDPSTGASPPPLPTPVKLPVIDPTTPEGQAQMTKEAHELLAKRSQQQADQKTIVGSTGFQPAKTFEEFQQRINPPVLPEAQPLLQGLAQGIHLTEDQKIAQTANNEVSARVLNVIDTVRKGGDATGAMDLLNQSANKLREHWRASFELGVLGNDKLMTSVLGAYMSEDLLTGYGAWVRVQGGSKDPRDLQDALKFENARKNIPDGLLIPAMQTVMAVTGLNPQGLAVLAQARTQQFAAEKTAEYQGRQADQGDEALRIQGKTADALIKLQGAQADLITAQKDDVLYDTDEKRKTFNIRYDGMVQTVEESKARVGLTMSETHQKKLQTLMAVESHRMEQQLKPLQVALEGRHELIQEGAQLMGGYIAIDKEIGSLLAAKQQAMMMGAKQDSPEVQGYDKKIAELVPMKQQTLDMINGVNDQLRSMPGMPDLLTGVQEAVWSSKVDREQLAGTLGYPVMTGDYFKKNAKGQLVVVSYKDDSGRIINPETAMKAQELGRQAYTVAHMTEFPTHEQFFKTVVDQRQVWKNGQMVTEPVTLKQAAGSPAAAYKLYDLAFNEFNHARTMNPDAYTGPYDTNSAVNQLAGGDRNAAPSPSPYVGPKGSVRQQRPSQQAPTPPRTGGSMPAPQTQQQQNIQNAMRGQTQQPQYPGGLTAAEMAEYEQSRQGYQSPGKQALQAYYEARMRGENPRRPTASELSNPIIPYYPNPGDQNTDEDRRRRDYSDRTGE